MGQTYDIQSQPAQSLRNDLTQMQWASLADNLDASLADDRLNRQDTWMKDMRDEINSKLGNRFLIMASFALADLVLQWMMTLLRSGQGLPLIWRITV